jgi:hypothetical protein
LFTCFILGISASPCQQKEIFVGSALKKGNAVISLLSSLDSGLNTSAILGYSFSLVASLNSKACLTKASSHPLTEPVGYQFLFKYTEILTSLSLQVRRELSIQLNRQVVLISRINVTQNMKL